MTKQSAIARDAIAWHLWHPRSEIVKSYESNLELLRTYQSMEGHEIRKLASAQAPFIGRTNKYEQSNASARP